MESYEFKIFGENTLSSAISLFKTIYLYESIGQEVWVNQDTGKKEVDTVYISSIFTGRVG
jgi:hypothetical protein